MYRFGVFVLNMVFWRFFSYSVAMWLSRTEKMFRRKNFLKNPIFILPCYRALEGVLCYFFFEFSALSLSGLKIPKKCVCEPPFWCFPPLLYEPYCLRYKIAGYVMLHVWKGYGSEGKGRLKRCCCI